jgi:hypothetical protein
MAKKLILGLTGGLGNQLFQIAAALDKANGAPVFVDCSIGKPRVNKANVPEVFSFLLPAQVQKIENLYASSFESKVFGYLLRNGLEKNGLEKIPGAFFLVKLTGSVVLSFRYRRLVWTLVNTGVGFDPKINPKGNLLIGYFQTYIHLEKSSVIEKMNLLSPMLSQEIVGKFTKLAERTNPLIVHYRLGDYKEEKHFGIPDQIYYRRAIEEQWNSGKYDSIWVFSDEIEGAKKLFPHEFMEFVTWVEGLEDHPALSLEIMRLGKGYVIANSTYSWWGAMLSHTDKPDVIAPKPWFKSAEEPSQLIPDNWVRLSGWNQS